MRATMFKGNLSFAFVVNVTHPAFNPDIAWVIPGYSSQHSSLFVL